jgi:hypothetical protein
MKLDAESAIIGVKNNMAQEQMELLLSNDALIDINITNIEVESDIDHLKVFTSSI